MIFSSRSSPPARRCAASIRFISGGSACAIIASCWSATSAIVFIGGFNVADEYDGDGVTRGWCDVGVRIENPALAGELAAFV